MSVKLANGATLWNMVRSGSSYCSQSELPLTFGLGKTEKVARIEVTWPSGRKDVVSDVDANQAITIQEGKGVVANQPMSLH